MQWWYDVYIFTSSVVMWENCTKIPRSLWLLSRKYPIHLFWSMVIPPTLTTLQLHIFCDDGDIKFIHHVSCMWYMLDNFAPPLSSYFYFFPFSNPTPTRPPLSPFSLSICSSFLPFAWHKEILILFLDFLASTFYHKRDFVVAILLQRSKGLCCGCSSDLRR